MSSKTKGHSDLKFSISALRPELQSPLLGNRRSLTLQNFVDVLTFDTLTAVQNFTKIKASNFQEVDDITQTD